MFRVTAEVYTGGDVGPGAAGYDPGPSYNPYGAAGRLPGRPAPMQGGPARNARLVSNDGRTYPLSVGSTVIGRGDQANLRLPDVGISRRHARHRLRRRPGRAHRPRLHQRHLRQRPAGLRGRA